MNLSSEQLDLLSKIDPNISSVVNVSPSNYSQNSVSVTFSDGAAWRIDLIDNGRFEPVLRKLGSAHLKKALSPILASCFIPEKQEHDGHYIPHVDCGEGFRQLTWNEAIKEDDEWLGGATLEPVWQKCTNTAGGLYRPTHSNAKYAPYALIRRKL